MQKAFKFKLGPKVLSRQLISKGMFLYAKILLSSIELLTDVTAIREELKVLPEDLNDA